MAQPLAFSPLSGFRAFGGAMGYAECSSAVAEEPGKPRMSRKGLSTTSAVLIFALTLSGVVIWHCRDQRIPQDDCANLACTSLEIYQTWEQQGVAAGLNAL